MCVHHIVFYSSCGHFEKNAPLCIQSHCEAVEKALRFYNDQPDYRLADSELYSRFNISTTSQAACPRACPEKWPPFTSDPRVTQWDKFVYQNWVDDIQRKQIAHYEIYKQTMSQSLQHQLDNASENIRRNKAQAYNPDTPSCNPKPRNQALRFTNAPFPANQLEHMVTLERAQANKHATPKWNTIIYTVNGGCGRHNLINCLHGHFGAGKPQCPYLIACRTPWNLETRETHMLANFDPAMRGGAVNEAEIGYKQENTKAALVYKGDIYGSMEMVELEKDKLDMVFTPALPPIGPSWHRVFVGWTLGP